MSNPYPSHNQKMNIKNRNGVLGLETTRQVITTYLILAVTAIAIILSLVSIQDGVGDTIDNTDNTVTNETGGFINTTGYQLSETTDSQYVSGSASVSEARNSTSGGVILAGNFTVANDGTVTNATTTTWDSVEFDYTWTQDRARTDNIVGNVSGGLETFFGSTGTIFSILIVVVIILAISIIIWAVGRFGMQAEQRSVEL